MKRIPAVISPLALLTISGLTHAAYYYEAKTTVESGGRRAEASTVSAWVDGENTRVEFEDGDAGPLFSAGSYLVSNDGGQTLYVVDPEERTVAEVDLAQIFQMVGNLTEASQGVVQVEFSDFSSEKLGEAPGEPVLGYPTTHYRYKTGYTMKIGVLGFTRENRSDTDLEFDCTDAVDAEGFKVWLRPDRMRTGNEAIDQLIEQQYATLHCLPLRNRAVTRMTGSNGRESTATTTLEVTTLREGDAPPEAFVVPADYTRRSLIPDLSATGAEAGQPRSESEAEAPKKRLRLKDLLGR